MKLDRATVCLATKNRQVSHAFYTALGFATVGELGDDGLPEPLQFEIQRRIACDADSDARGSGG